MNPYRQLAYQHVSAKVVPMPSEEDETFPREAANVVVNGLSGDLGCIGGVVLMREVAQAKILEAIRASVMEAWRDGFQQGWLAKDEAAFVQHQQRTDAMYTAILAAAARGAPPEEIVTTGLLAQNGSSPEEAAQLYRDLTTVQPPTKECL